MKARNADFTLLCLSLCLSCAFRQVLHQGKNLVPVTVPDTKRHLIDVGHLKLSSQTKSCMMQTSSWPWERHQVSDESLRESCYHRKTTRSEMYASRCSAMSGSGAGMLWLMGESSCPPLCDMELTGTSQHYWVRGRVGWGTPGAFSWLISAGHTSQYHSFKEAALVITAFAGKEHTRWNETNHCNQWVSFIPAVLLVLSGHAKKAGWAVLLWHIESKVKGLGKIWILCGNHSASTTPKIPFQ